MDQRQATKPFQQFRHRFIIGLYIAAIIAIAGITLRIVQYVKLHYATEQGTILPVAVIKAAHGPETEEIVLPGNLIAWHDATIFARTNGYVTEWMTDIGSRVSTGDTLALIAAPEVNDQLRQTEADLKTAIANNELAQSTARRWIILLKTNSVSKQDADEKISDAKAKLAIVASTRANRDRLRALVSFQRVLAPFDGVVMARNTDVGRLINAGSNPLQPLFRVVQFDRLRIYVRVPQIYTSRVKSDLTGELHLPQHPGKVFTAKLVDTARAIDPNTRTLLIQFYIDNKDNKLLSGSYALVHLKFPAFKNSVRLPVNTLLFRAEGLQVATLDGDDKVILKSITIGRDFGDEVEVVAGLKPDEIVIINPPDSIITGDKVHVVSIDGKDKATKS